MGSSHHLSHPLVLFIKNVIFMRFKDSARRRCLEETESRLTRFVIYALSARTIGQCSRFQSLSLGFVADIVLIDARERSFSKVTLFDSNRRERRGGQEGDRRNQDRSVLILDYQENIARKHDLSFSLILPA